MNMGNFESDPSSRKGSQPRNTLKALSKSRARYPFSGSESSGLKFSSRRGCLHVLLEPNSFFAFQRCVSSFLEGATGSGKYSTLARLRATSSDTKNTLAAPALKMLLELELQVGLPATSTPKSLQMLQRRVYTAQRESPNPNPGTPSRLPPRASKPTTCANKGPELQTRFRV